MAGVLRFTVYDHFEESAQVCSIIEELSGIYDQPIALESSQERFTVIVDKYQEQPHLLDPHLEVVLGKLFSIVENMEAAPTLQRQAFRYIYLLSKLRGPKVIVRWFSHEVSDFEPVLSRLEAQDRNDFESWEVRYVLLLWLSILVLIPFDLSRLDVSAESGSLTLLTVDRVLDMAKLYLAVTDKSRDVAAMMCAKFLSRPDVLCARLATFMDWALNTLSSTNGSTMGGLSILCGVLTTLSTLFKVAKREDTMPYAGAVLTKLRECGFAVSSNTLLRKLNTKLVQRLGSSLLPVHVASWRYQRGSRSLEQTLAAAASDGDQFTSTNSKKNTKHKHGKVEIEEDYDVPEEIEMVVEVLLEALTDRDSTVVRWSAAKGVGRITGRLPQGLADEVVGSLLEIFNDRDNDTGWHGCCLALAELGRRGLLLPERLSDVVPIVLKALEYDERRGYSSVGSHVRDAACYVCWSFARAYDPEQLQPYVHVIARALVVAMVFDREVNCRKAASAAFQENVGRQGTFPHGIDILTTADYFSVGVLNSSYLNVSVSVAKYTEYTHPLIDHLVRYKIAHWDSSLRELSAKALHNLTILDPTYMKDKVLPSIIPLVISVELFQRHGALLAVGELTNSLYQYSVSSSCKLSDLLSREMMLELPTVLMKIQSHIPNVFSGVSGDLMRSAALRYIELMSMSELQVDDQNLIDMWQNIIDDNLAHTKESIRLSAVRSFGALCRQYYIFTADLISTVQGSLFPRYIAALESQNHFVRMGHFLALGSLPQQLLHGKLTTILSNLQSSVTAITTISSIYTEARRDAVRSLLSVAQCVGVKVGGDPECVLCEQNVPALMDALLVAMFDYTTDSRGDIGSVVREAAMSALEQLCIKFTTVSPSLLSADIVGKVICGIVQQCNEKIDRTRSVACSTLLNLLHHQPKIPHIPHHHQLTKIFSKTDTQWINWAVPHSSFPLTVQLLAIPVYSYRTLLGLVVSVGDLTESTVRHSSAALLGHLKALGESYDDLHSFSETLLLVFSRNHGDNRVIKPLLKTIDMLMSNGIFRTLSETNCDTNFPVILLELMKKEMKGCKDPVKLLTAVNVYCGLLAFSGMKKGVLTQLMVLLGHSYPKVRRATAEQLYVSLLSMDDVLAADDNESAMVLLTDTPWDGSMDIARDQRNTLCHILSLPPPKAKQPSKASNKIKQRISDEMGYKDLVERTGY